MASVKKTENTRKKAVRTPEEAVKKPAGKPSRPENERLKEEIRTLKKNRDPEETLSYAFMPYVLGFAAVFLFVCFIIPDSMSFLGYLIRFFAGLLSFGAWGIPLLLAVEAFTYKADVRARRLHARIFVLVGFLLSLAALSHLFTAGIVFDKNGFTPGTLFDFGMKYVGGGLFGGAIAGFLQKIMGFGAWIVTLAAAVLLGFASFNITPLDMISMIREKGREAAYNARMRQKEYLEGSAEAARARRDADEAKNAADNAAEPPKKKRKAHLDGVGGEAEAEEAARKEAEAEDAPVLAISPDALKLATAGVSDTMPDTVPWPEDDADGEISPAPDQAAFDRIREKHGEAVRFAADERKKGQPAAEKSADGVKEIDLSAIFTEDATISSAGGTASISDVMTDGAEGAVTAITPDGGEPEEELIEDGKEAEIVEEKPNLAELYRYPDVELLKADPNPATFSVTDEQKDTAVRLVNTLAEFRVSARIYDICCGPTVTRYELQPETGVRVKQIQNLSDDIALHLGATGVRIEAPIPGKQAVGIEVPNKKVSTVYLRGLIENPAFQNQKSKLAVVLGMDVAGSPVYMDIAKMPHLLIAGTTGSGKSVCINCILVSLLYRTRPDECKLMLIDPKMVEFAPYNGIPHLLVPVVSEPKKAAGALAWAVNEMERRWQLLQEVGVRDLDSYNRAVADDPERETLPKIVIIIDELADLMMSVRDSIETSICRIAQKARAAGMHLILGTQRPSTDVITGLMKSNIPSRIAFTVASQVDSRVIMDNIGAEKLLGKGDMLFSPVGSMKPMRVQGAFVSDDEVEDINAFLKSAGNVEYDDVIMHDIEKEAERCADAGKKKGRADDEGADYDVDDRDAILASDEFIFDAIKIAVENKQVSTSLLQRKLSLGYSRAARIVDKLEKLGVVGPFEGSKPRRVLITYEEYMEMKMNHDNA